MAQDQLIKELCSCTDNNGCSVEKGKGKRISDLKKKKKGGGVIIGFILIKVRFKPH